MTILDNIAQMNENQWLSERLEDNPAEDAALRTTARIATAHIWPFLAEAVSDDDYRNRRGVKRDEVLYICGSISPHVASALTTYILDGFDKDFAILQKTAQEEFLAADELLPSLAEGLGGHGGGGGGGDDDEPGLFETPGSTASLHTAPGGGVHGPYRIEKRDGKYDVVNDLGESKGSHATRGEAREQQKAMYANIPEAREQAEEDEERKHEGALHLAQDPYSRAGIFPGLPHPQAQDEDEDEDDDEKVSTVRPIRPHREKGHEPGLFSTPGSDWQYGNDPYYNVNTNWGQTQLMEQQKAEQQKAAAVDQYGHVHLGAFDWAEFERNLGQPDRVPGKPAAMTDQEIAQHMRDRHDYDIHPDEMQYADGIHGQAHYYQPEWQDHDHGESDDPNSEYVGPVIERHGARLAVDKYGHLGARHWRRDPENDDVDWDREFEESEAESRAPERDVHFGPEEPHYEADWDRPEYGAPHGEGEWRGGAKERGPKTSERRTPVTYEPEWEPEPSMDEPLSESASWAMGSRELRRHMALDHMGPGLSDSARAAAREVLDMPTERLRAVHDNAHDQGSPVHTEHDHSIGESLHHLFTSAEKKEEKGEVPCPICHKMFEPGELEEHMEKVHGAGEKEGEEKKGGKKPPGAARAGQSKAKPSAGRQTHRPSRGRPKGPSKEGQLVRSSERPPGARRSPVAPSEGYDPSEAFPGYYGEPERPQRRRTAQAPLVGNSDVPADPESNTGASGGFNPGGALNVAMPGGTVDTDFNQQDQPQDIQAQLGQMPALSHKIGAKLAEMATEVLVHNPHLTASAAMEVALSALRLYPKVAAGGADYLREPGTEGAPPEVLSACPQCQREAYNRQINRCHFCGFYDAGLEPSIEVT